MKVVALLTLLACGAVTAQTSGVNPYSLYPPATGGLREVAQSPASPVLPDEPSAEGKKSVPLAALYSLLLPGMGELYAGDYSFGKYLTMLEGGLIVTLVGFDRYANWLQDDARTYAASHAQVNINGKDDRFFNAIGDFNNVYAYNEELLRLRSPEDMYNPQSSYFWNWDSPGNREVYRGMKVTSDERFNDTRFVAAAMFVNHFVSAINAARTAIAHNKQSAEGSGFDLHAGVMGGLAAPQGIRLTLTRNF